MRSAEIESLDGLMARYVAGALPEPARVLVATHLSLRPERRLFVDGLESVAGDALEQMEPVALSNRDSRLSSIFNSAALPVMTKPVASNGILPAVLRDFIGYDVDTIPWKTKMPGYREFSLGEIDGCEANMLWIKAGRKMPSHTHEGSELTLVLDGAFRDANGRYGRGDISLADEHVDHRPIAEDERACICFAVTDAPLRLTGSYRQFFSDFLGR
jgi:putative transcriptional regulator